jgi:alkyl hydroperoxide reductase subunit AhpF
VATTSLTSTSLETPSDSIKLTEVLYYANKYGLWVLGAGLSNGARAIGGARKELKGGRVPDRLHKVEVVFAENEKCIYQCKFYGRDGKVLRIGARYKTYSGRT